MWVNISIPWESYGDGILVKCFQRLQPAFRTGQEIEALVASKFQKLNANHWVFTSRAQRLKRGETHFGGGSIYTTLPKSNPHIGWFPSFTIFSYVRVYHLPKWWLTSRVTVPQVIRRWNIPKKLFELPA